MKDISNQMQELIKFGDNEKANYVKNKFKTIEKGGLEESKISDKEKEIAQKILTDLQGTLVIRATSILNFCLKAIQYTEV